MGFDYETAMRWPVGKLQDIMAIHQIKIEGAKWADKRVYDPEKMDSYDAIPDFR